MNSFQELNFYSNTGVPFTDDRAYTISFSANAATNSNVSIFENQEHTTIPGIDITSVVSTPRNITLSINVASVTGANVVWRQELPGNVTVSNVAGTFTASGLNGKGAWDVMKYANVQMPTLWSNNWSYTSTITYPNTANVTLSNTYSWTTNVQVTSLNQLSQDSDISYYPLTQANILQNTPTIIDLGYSPYATTGYTLTVSSNSNSAVSNLSSTGSYASSTFSTITGNLTIVGNLLGVNNHLENISYWPSGDDVWQAKYTLNNPASNYISTAYQIIKPAISLQDLTEPNDYYYPSNVANVILNTPQITLTNSSGYFDQATVTLTPNVTTGITSLSSTAPGGTSSFNPTTKVLTISGDIDNINAHLANVIYQPVTSYYNPWTLTYKLNPGSDYEKTKIQNIANYDAKYLSQPMPVYYDTNRYIGADLENPLITDTISNPAGTFTINIGPVSSNTISYIRTSPDNGLHANGEVAYSSTAVSYNNSTKNMVITGNKSTVNGFLSEINFLPATDLEANFDVRYALTIPTGETITRYRNFVWSNSHVVSQNYDLPRSYISNTSDQNIFSSNPPQIYETVYNTNPGNLATYKIALTTTGGNLNTTWTTGITTTGGLTGNLVMSGTSADINSALDQRIQFYPHRDLVATQTLRYRQWRNDVLQIDSNISVTGSARTAPFVGTGTYTYTTVGNTSVGLSYEQAFYLTAKATVIGGGGGGGGTNTGKGGAGGGAGGQISESSGIIFGTTTAFMTVGGGGGGGSPSASAGDPSSIKKLNNTTILSATGGAAGAYSTSTTGGTGGGGASGGSVYYVGGNYGGGGGGGKGAGGNGSNGGYASGPSAYPPGGAGGNGGLGKAVTLHNAQLPLTYAGGGGGGAGNGIQQYTVFGGSSQSASGSGGYSEYPSLNTVAPTSASRYGSGGGGARGAGAASYGGGSGYQGIIVVTFY